MPAQRLATYKEQRRHPQGSARALPVAGVLHRCPRFLRRLRLALLQELDRVVVGRAREGHYPVARRPVDGDAGLHQPLAGRVDVVDLIGEMAEVARLAVVLGIPVIGQFDLRAGPALLFTLLDLPEIVAAGQKHQSIAVLLVDPAAGLLQAELVAIEVERRVEIADAQHGVQISHGQNLTRGPAPDGRRGRYYSK